MVNSLAKHQNIADIFFWYQNMTQIVYYNVKVANLYFPKQVLKSALIRGVNCGEDYDHHYRRKSRMELTRVCTLYRNWQGYLQSVNLSTRTICFKCSNETWRDQKFQKVKIDFVHIFERKQVTSFSNGEQLPKFCYNDLSNLVIFGQSTWGAGPLNLELFMKKLFVLF